MPRRLFWRYLGMGAIISAFTWGIVVLMQNPTFQGIFPISPLMKLKNAGIVITLGTLLWTFLSLGFEQIDTRLPGSKNHKAFFFVSLEGVLFMIYASEPLPHLQTIDEILNWIKWATILSLQGILLQYLFATERWHYMRKPFVYWRGMIIYVLSFLVFRWFEYEGLGLYHLPTTQLGLSLFWVALMGATIGFVFFSLQRYMKHQKKTEKALSFTLQFFLPLTLLYHFYVLVQYQVSIPDLFARVFFDTLAVGLASWIVVQWQIDEPTKKEKHELKPMS